jgi:membrane-associated phospholipid phosphatase
MSFKAPIGLPPTRADLAVARAAARGATPATERPLQVITWLADEKMVLGGAILLWLYARAVRPEKDLAPEADHILCCVALAGLLPHLFKRLVRRRRPDRTVVHGRRHGIPRSGNAWDSFPSGHALHLGAIAGPVARIVPRSLRPFVWSSVLALAASRILLLAHYPSDVAAGLALGVALDKSMGRVSGASRAFFLSAMQGRKRTL